jgi:hypothetical protein
MNRYTLVLSAAVLSALSFTAAADAKSDAQQQVAIHTAMGVQARASKDFGMGAHCAKLVRDNAAIVANSTSDTSAARTHEALAAVAEQRAETHRAMLRTASFSRDPGMASHCRNLIEQYTAEAAAQRGLAKSAR